MMKEDILLLQKFKLMKELMELSIRIHKLNTKLKKWTKSFSQKICQFPKVLVQEKNGAGQRGKASHDQSEQSIGNRKGKKGNDKNKKGKRKQIKNKKNIEKNARGKRVNKKKETDKLKIQEENLNIISINARSFVYM